MLKPRIIPCLLLQDGGLVKTEKFKKARYVGDPINAVKIFNEKEVDELIFLDINASRTGREPNLSLIKDLASECFMPIAYGGGIKSIDHIRSILKIGVEKVILNHQLLNDISFVKKAADHFGSSTIIGAVDVKKDFWGHYKVYNHVTQKTMPGDLLSFIMTMQTLGVGEVFLNNVDRDGTYLGLDVDLIKTVNAKLEVPLIVCGGTSSLEDIKKVIAQTQISAVAAGSLFVYQGPHRAVLISYPPKQELEALYS